MKTLQIFILTGSGPKATVINPTPTEKHHCHHTTTLQTFSRQQQHNNCYFCHLCCAQEGSCKHKLQSAQNWHNAAHSRLTSRHGRMRTDTLLATTTYNNSDKADANNTPANQQKAATVHCTWLKTRHLPSGASYTRSRAFRTTTNKHQRCAAAHYCCIAEVHHPRT